MYKFNFELEISKQHLVYTDYLAGVCMGSGKSNRVTDSFRDGVAESITD